MLFFWKTHLKHRLLSYTGSLNMRATHSSFLKCNEICKEFIKCTVHVCVKATRLYLFFSFVAQIARKTNIVQMVREIYFATVAIVQYVQQYLPLEENMYLLQCV